jgi:hypothetical protein
MNPVIIRILFRNTSKMMKTALLIAAFFAPCLPALTGPAEGQTPIEAARGIGDYLVRTQRRDGRASYWAQYEGGPEKKGAAKRHFPVSFYSGAAGTGFFLLNLHKVTEEKKYLEAARGVGERLLALAKPLPGGGVQWNATYARRERSIPEGYGVGLYTGNAGIGLFLQMLADATDDKRFRRTAAAAFERILREAVAEGSGCHWTHAFQDIIGGEAGIGLALLEMHLRTGEGRYQKAAQKAGAWLLSKALRQGASVYWKKYGYLDPNFSHGTSGIALFLSALKDEGAQKAALASAAWVESTAVSTPGGGLHWKYYAGTPPEGKTNWVMNSWCHGAPGTVRLFLRLHRATGDKRPLKVACKAGEGIRADCKLREKQPFFYNPTYCCGAAGLIDAFVHLFRATRDRQWLSDAAKLAGAVTRSFRKDKEMPVYATYDKEDEKARNHPYVSTGFMLGNAGIGYALLCLHAAESGLWNRLIPFPDQPEAVPLEIQGGYKPPVPGKQAGQPAEPPAESKPPAESRPAPPAGTNEKNYVILTPLPESDAYWKALEEFKKIHPEAKVLRFTAGEVEKVSEQLRELEPRFVVVVLKPEDLDVNFQSRFLKVCTGLDADPFCDFSYGYITGATAKEALGFVRGIARASKKTLPRRILYAPVTGGQNARRESSALHAYGVDWPMVTLCYGKVGNREMTDQEIRKRLSDFRADYKGKGVIMTGGHGLPPRISHGISGSDLRALKIDLSPAVIYNYACFSGCVGRAFNWERGRTIQSKTVPKKESLALAILNAGVSAYIASIEPRPAGPGMGSELIYALNKGGTLGEARRREYDQLALGYISWGEEGLVVPIYEEGKPRKFSTNAVRDMMMRSASGAVLYGDPALRICPKPKDLLVVHLTKDGEGFLLDCTTMLDSYVFAYDVTRLWSRSTGMAVKLYAVAELPEGVSTLGRVEVVEAKDARGQDVETGYLAWAIEKKDGTSLLHVRISGPPRSALMFKGTRVRFRLTRGPHTIIPKEDRDAAEEESAEQGGGSPAERVLNGPWKYAWKDAKFRDILRFVESFMDRYGKDRDMKVRFEFDEDVRSAADKTVSMELDSEPLKKGLDRVCKKLGLKYTVDADKNVVRFSRAGKDGEKGSGEK